MNWGPGGLEVNVFARYDLVARQLAERHPFIGEDPVPAMRAALLAAGLPVRDLEVHRVGEQSVLVIRDRIGDWVYDGQAGELHLLHETIYAGVIPPRDE